jgi:hypothetical protein
MIRLLPFLLLIGCTDLSDYPTTPTTSTPGVRPVNNDNRERLLPTNSLRRWEIGQSEEVNQYTIASVSPSLGALTFQVTGAPDWMKINTNFPGKQMLVISGAPTVVGKWRIDIHANSATGYDDTFVIIEAVDIRRPAVEG